VSIVDLKAEPQAASEDFEDANSPRDLNLDEEDDRVITRTNFGESIVNDDLMSVPGVEMSFPSSLPTMPNILCKYSFSR
jgi:hypothetical protein